ncbi:MAG: hypothetical protein P8Z49_02270 [Acidobacteriota bacterium]
MRLQKRHVIAMGFAGALLLAGGAAVLAWGGPPASAESAACCRKTAAAGIDGAGAECQNKAQCAAEAKAYKAAQALRADLASWNTSRNGAQQAVFEKGVRSHLALLVSAHDSCKAQCSTMKDAAAKCPYEKEVKARFQALKEDLSKMKKGIAPADRASFDKTLKKHIERVVGKVDSGHPECPALKKNRAASV